MICVFKCVSCGDKMHYSIEKGALECSTCGSLCNIENYDIENMTYEGHSMLKEDEFDNFACPTCGAKVTMQDGSAKMKCSYCGSELAAFGIREGEELSPEKIIPCKLTKADAKTKLLGWWLNHETMPKYNEKKLKMEFQDIYVPVWLFNADVITKIEALVEPYQYDHEGERRVTETVRKTYESKLVHVPFDSSRHIEDELFYDIEPFTYSEMEDFRASYLSGHMAECYHIEPECVIPRAVGRVKQFAFDQGKDYLDSSIGGGVILDMLKQEADVTPTEIIYALVPMWVCTYVYNGQRKNIYINGQTGKVAGEVLFAGNKFKHDVIFYGICSSVMSIAVMFAAICLFMIGAMEALTAVFTLYVGIGFSPVINALFKRQRNRDFMGINEEVQIQQGMKISATVSGIIVLIIGIVAICADFALGAITVRFVKDRFSVVFWAFVLGLLGAGVLTYLFAQRLYKFEKFHKKTKYYDYVKMGSMRELDSQIYRN